MCGVRECQDSEPPPSRTILSLKNRPPNFRSNHLRKIMAPPHRAKSKQKLKHRNIPVPSAPKGPTRTYTINKPWSPVGQGHSIRRSKSRITSICRTLGHKSGEKALPGYKRVELERELKALRSEEAVGRAEVRRQVIMRQDKRVKFFGGVPLECHLCASKLMNYCYRLSKS
jgi:hypothetical protein